MPSAFASPTWRNVSEALQQHRVDCAAFAVEIESVFASLAMLRESLHHQGRQLARERASVQEKSDEAAATLAETASLRQTLETRQAQLETARAEIELLKTQLTQSAAASSDATSEDHALHAELSSLREERSGLCEQLADLRTQRDAALSRCEATEAEVRKLTACALDASALRQEASQARAELAETRKELNDIQAALAAAREEIAVAREETAAAREETAAAQQETVAARQELISRQDEWLESLRSAPAERANASESPEATAWSEAAKEQFAAFQLRVEQSLEECSKWAAAAIQATETREELAALRAELAARPSDVASAPMQTNGEWEWERGALETELELVRARAAELYESLSRQERGLSELRSELGGDLKQLRRLVESQAEFMVARQGAEPAPREAFAGPTTSAASKAVAQPDSQGQDVADPVLSSVMAQFARLQQDVAERRKKKKP